MSMHLMKIHVVEKTKSKKFRNSKSAKASRESKESWEALMKKYEIQPKKKQKSKKLDYKLEVPNNRSTKHIKSIDDGVGHTTKPVNPIGYSGDGIIGLSVLHKSNTVPVFRQQDALDISKMRR